MSKRKWYTRALYTIVALAMTVGLVFVPAVAAPLPDSEPAASPDVTDVECGSLEAGIGYGAVGTDMGTAVWDTTVVRPADTGSYSGKLSPGTTDSGLAAAKVPYGGDLTAFSTIGEANMTFWTYYNTAGKTSFAALWLDTDADDVADVLLVNKAWSPQATMEPNKWLEVHPYGPADQADGKTWHVYGYTAATGALASSVTLCDTVSYDGNDWKSLAEWAALVCAAPDGTFGDAEVLCVGQMIGGVPGSADCFAYADDITIDDVTLGMEPCYELEPDIAYNVKTADEKFTVMDACGEVDPDLVSNWIVYKGCGGTAEIVGGGDGFNFITVRMVVTGDCSITADVAGIPGAVSAEKKWGEISRTEIEVTGTAPSYTVCDTVYADFWWEECTVLEELPADGAILTWWLMDLDAWNDAGSLNLGVGIEDIEDCYTYTDPLDDPYDIIDDLYGLYPVGGGAAFDGLGEKIDTVSGDFGVTGVSCVDVNTGTTPTSVLLVIHADYPISKHGQNVECVEWYKWIVPPPPTVEKFPLIAWVGEKVVVEWNLGEGYLEDEVKWTREAPSVGVFAESGWYAEDAVTDVDIDGVARVVVHSDKSGKMNILASVVGDHPTLQQGFIVYFLAFESVELKNIEDSDLPNPAWDVTGLTEEMLDVGASTKLRVRVKGYFVDPDPEFQSTRPIGVLDSDGDGTPDFVLPAGRWVLPDDWNTLAGGAFWQVQKPHWDLMDELDDAVWTMVDAVTKTCDELGPYDDEDVNSPSKIADYPVIGPFSTAQPCTALQWVTTIPVGVLADPFVTGDRRTTVVPNYECNEFDAVMPPARLYIVADSGTLSTEDKGSIYYDMLPCEDFPGEIFKAYSFPYYGQEIPASELLDPYYGEGPAGYRWDSWDTDPANAPVGVKGPYDFYEGLPLWAFDYTVINNSFGLDIDEEDEQLLGVYTDNHGEAWAEFTMTTIGATTIQALATYPFLVGDFVPVVSNEVTKTSVDLKDIVSYVEDVDAIRKMLYVFVRNYDGTPAECEPVEWAIDGPYGTIEELYEGDEGTSCYNECLDVTCIRDISVGSRSAQSCTREWLNDAERDGFVADAVFADEDTADDYAIAGIKVLSSLGEDVDVLIRVHDCWQGEPDIRTLDVVLVFGNVVPGPVEWTCPIGSEPLIAPNPGAGRPFLSVDADPTGITVAPVTAELWGIYYLDETTGVWSYYIPGFASTLTLLEPDKYYYVVVSGACTLTIPQE